MCCEPALPAAGKFSTPASKKSRCLWTRSPISHRSHPQHAFGFVPVINKQGIVVGVIAARIEVTGRDTSGNAITSDLSIAE
jgi:hypothetical protein